MQEGRKMSTDTSLQPQTKATSLPAKIGFFTLFLACSMLVFVMEPRHYPLFPTNGNILFASVVSACFLAAGILLQRNNRLASIGGVMYAFFIASMVNLSWDLFGGYGSTLLGRLGVWSDSNQFTGLAKFYEFVLALIPILALTWLGRGSLGSIMIKRGIKSKWGWGIGLLVLVNYFTSVMIFYGQDFALEQLGSAIVWGLVFSLSNSMLEELWVRGVFFKKLQPLLGGAGTVLITSLWFAAMHSISLAYLPAYILPVFIINTFTLGLACGILMLKTESIWGAWLVHAAADLFLFIAMLAVR
jgi:membrane protease YdiL (CAAX protease family)